MGIEIKPVGVVKTGYTQKEETYDYSQVKSTISKIEVFPEFRDALLRIKEEKRLIVLYWMHKLSPEDRRTMQVHPRGAPESPLTGVFATRSPRRPNPIGVSEVELMKVEENVLVVRGLDAAEGSPVIDIKASRLEYVP